MTVWTRILGERFWVQKVINIGSKVYVHITGLKNGSVPVNKHQINLKKCSITDGFGLQEVLLIQGYHFKKEQLET